MDVLRTFYQPPCKILRIDMPADEVTVITPKGRMKTYTVDAYKARCYTAPSSRGPLAKSELRNARHLGTGHWILNVITAQLTTNPGWMKVMAELDATGRKQGNVFTVAHFLTDPTQFTRPADVQHWTFAVVSLEDRRFLFFSDHPAGIYTRMKGVYTCTEMNRVVGARATHVYPICVPEDGVSYLKVDWRSGIVTGLVHTHSLPETSSAMKAGTWNPCTQF
jgi:hypothetical protein